MIPTTSTQQSTTNSNPMVATNTTHKLKLKRRRNVTFVPDAQIKHTLNRRDYTEAEKRRTWTTAVELNAMKENCRMIICLIAKKMIEAGEDDLRGLEKKTAEGQARKTTTRITARSAVFREQRKQKKKGVSDADKLASKYMKITKFSLDEARTIALSDETEARLTHPTAPKISPTSKKSESESKSKSPASPKKLASSSIKTPDRPIRRKFMFMSFIPMRKVLPV